MDPAVREELDAFVARRVAEGGVPTDYYARRSNCMKASTQVAVIGGGVVGASVLYHLTKAGWTDVVLIERKELTAGSTWHSAGGMHTLNGDPNVSKLQQYTIELYKDIEAQSGQSCSIHLPGGLMLANDRERLDWLRMAKARGRYLGMDLEIITPSEAKALFPLLEEQYFVGALFDPVEGHVDPTGVTNAYAICARQAGAEVYRHTWVNDLRQRADGTWDVITDKGEIHAEHIVNAGGLWAREVGRMIGLELPVLGMEHMYLVTEHMDEVAEHNAATGHEMPMALDFEGEIYIRQEQGGMLMGTYEQACVPWSPQRAPWSFDMELLEPDLDRIAPSLEIAFKHYPAMATAGIKTIVNGPFTFAPDGNPLVGPIRGIRNCWVACAVMAGLSQGGGVGLALATWMTDGRPRHGHLGRWTSPASATGRTSPTPTPRCARTTAGGSGSRSRTRSCPPARPLHTTPIYDRLTEHNAVWGAGFGLEHPLWFQRPGEDPVEDVTFRRSNAFPIVAEECRAVRERVGLTECSNFAKYKVSGAGSGRLAAGVVHQPPAQGRADRADRDAQPAGPHRRRVLGRPDRRRRVLPVRVAGRRGPPLAMVPRPPPDRRATIRFEVLALSLVGLSVAGPHARDVLQSVTVESLATADFPFMAFRRIDIGMIPAWVGRMTYTGDLGYEIWVAPEHQRALFDLLWRRRAAVRHGAVRVPGADVDADGEDVRHLVPRVPADLHAARGRAWIATSSSTTTSSGAPRWRPRWRAARSGGWSTSRSTPTPTSPPT